MRHWFGLVRHPLRTHAPGGDAVFSMAGCAAEEAVTCTALSWTGDSSASAAAPVMHGTLINLAFLAFVEWRLDRGRRAYLVAQTAGRPNSTSRPPLLLLPSRHRLLLLPACAATSSAAPLHETKNIVCSEFRGD
jgi:hypothetical protein